MKLERDEMIADLLLRWEDGVENGNEVEATELCAEHPELLNDLKSKISDLKKMAWMSFDNSDEATVQNDELIGKTLGGRYKIELLVGQGGYGRVYKAFDPELQRHVAIKVPTNESLILGHSGKFLEEARRVAKLRAPGIVSVHDVGMQGDQCFIVSELIEGDNLSQLIEDSILPVNEAVQLVADIADNLQAAHDAGFIHRDIKPANILVDQQGKPLIADFGVASEIENIENISSGTLAYMSPEQVAKEPTLIDARSDVYSLGIVLYELLSGQLPYSATNPGALREQILFKQPVQLDDSVPPAIRLACLKCLAKHPADRYATANELALALRNSVSATSKPTKYLWTVVVASVLAVVALVVNSSGILNQSLPKQSQPSPLKIEGVLFNGKSRVITPLQSFAPCTIEVWIAPNRHNEKQFIVGSDVPGQFGVGLGIQFGNPMVETIGGGFHDPNRKATLHRWSHLAAVYGLNETRLYLDGMMIMSGPATQIPADDFSRFVVGNVGEDHSNMYFSGHLRSVRISNGERYHGDFKPNQKLKPDIDTALLYNESSFQNEKVVDLSGNENGGDWVFVTR